MTKQARVPIARSKLYASMSLLAVLAASACMGQVGDTSGAGVGVGPGSGAPAAGPGAGSSSSGGSSTGLGSGPGGSGPGDGGTGGATSPLAVSAQDLRLADGDPTTAACAISGETLVPFRLLTRLNRAEYDNTARDLLGDTTHTALSMLPADFGDGAFDNNASALNVDPSLTTTYMQLAETLAEQAMAPSGTGRALVLTCTTADAACARQVAGSFATRAWRRPATTGEVDNLLGVYTATRTAGFSFDNGIQMLVESALLSPNFLFRPEIDTVVDSHSQHPVGPYELSSRLSYFLWSTMPDATLQSSAGNGQLATRNGVIQQVKRMWADPKAEAFYSRFPGLWLGTSNITAAKLPDPTIYPQFDATLQAAMQGETAAFMREFITQDVNFFDFLDAKFTYANQKLAQFYAIPGQFGNQFTRVDLSGNTQRGGILTQGSYLLSTSAPDRTSPVLRGQWVLSRILATPAPPPPANVPPITPVTTGDGMTFRQKMSAHVANPVCATCHNLMDPIGFGLENYDGIGKWRTTDNGFPVDASGKLNTGQTFTGAIALESILKTDPRIPTAVVQYLMSYALGRSLGTASDQWLADQCAVGALATALQTQDNNRMASFVSRVAGMDAMRLRRAAP